MEKTTDIQRFQALMDAWLQASATKEQEKEMKHLASIIDDEACDEQTRRDLKLIRTVKFMSASYSDDDMMEAFLDNLTAQTPRKSWISRWVAPISAAAAVAVLATAGVWMWRTQETSSLPQPATQTHKIVAHNDVSVQIQPQTDPAVYDPIVSDEPTETEVTVAPAQRKVAQKAISKQEAEMLVPREVTDPKEALAILNQSCSVLKDCIDIADTQSQKAVYTVKENINSVIEII